MIDQETKQLLVAVTKVQGEIAGLGAQLAVEIKAIQGQITLHVDGLKAETASIRATIKELKDSVEDSLVETAKVAEHDRQIAELKAESKAHEQDIQRLNEARAWAIGAAAGVGALAGTLVPALLKALHIG
jgi:capsule polysaccharide export protein KpsE/RkpR